jgi:hypothetical protein
MADETPLPITITMASLPVGFRGTPQQLADAIAERLQLVTQQTFALFSVGATEPTSDVGPWAKDGSTWYYFDSETGAYVPFIIPQASLQFQISQTEPTEDGINVWYEIDENGEPEAIKLRVVSGGSVTWQSAYYLKTETYTQAETDLAIIKQGRYAARAKPNAAASYDIDGANHRITLDGTIFDSSGAYDDSNSRYTAPVKGIYEVTGLIYYDNDGGTASGMQAGVRIMKNGAVAGTDMGGGIDNTPSPNGSFWQVRLADKILLDSGDYIELAANSEDGVNSGQLEVNVGSHWEIALIQTEE